MAYYTNSRSPPPLQHPVPTHPAYIPEPPSTPASPQGYQRYTSSPTPGYAQPAPGSGPAPAHTFAPGAQYAQGPQQPFPVQAVAPVDFSAWGIDNATAQFGVHLGQSAVQAGQDYVQKNVRVSPSSQHLNELLPAVEIVPLDNARAPLSVCTNSQNAYIKLK